MNKLPLKTRKRLRRVYQDAASIWQPIAGCQLDHDVDLWIEIRPSSRSMGIGDSFRAADCFKIKGKWHHMYNGEPKEICSDYITHFMPIPQPPP
jgi:hypothetical protein